jgi:hypothetical protein
MPLDADCCSDLRQRHSRGQINFQDPDLARLGQTVLFVSSHKLVNEISDDSRFHKRAAATLREVRNLVGDALFTVRLFKPA